MFLPELTRTLKLRGKQGETWPILAVLKVVKLGFLNYPATGGKINSYIHYLCTQEKKLSAQDQQEKRIEGIIGPDEDDVNFEQARERFFRHLCQNLQLPCDITGIEDFNWEEPYVFGDWDQEEYKKLKKEQPSYKDVFQLIAIHNGVYSEWMLFQNDDLTAEVKRKSDNKKFYLGLAEIKTVEKGTQNTKLLDDYSVWLVNNR